MTGYESKKAAAQAKTIDEVNWADHEPNGLAQPAQKPADDVRGFLAARLTCWHRLTEKESDELVALFEVKPPQRPWVGLTDEEIAAFDWNHAVVDAECVRAIEAKLKEKNT